MVRKKRAAARAGSPPRGKQGMFAGQVVWVVGASGGLGSTIARAFLDEGAAVVLSGRNQTALSKVATDGPGRRRAMVLPLDIGDAAAVSAAAESIVARCQHIDVLVNTTSISAFGDFLSLEDEVWRRIYDAKLFAYVRTMRAVLPHMIARGRGAIVNLSGSGGKYPAFPSHIAGCSGNAAVNLVTKAVADLYIDRGIRTNCVAPGPIRSKRLASVRTADAVVGTRSRRPPAHANREKEWPLGSPQDVADAVLFLASERARHINGTVLTVDGGQTPTVV